MTTTRTTGTALRLAGHELISEGAPFEADGRSSYPARWGSGTGGTGRGRCACGAVSDVVDSGTKRKAWHRGHKLALSIQPRED